jgi:hypothetical protein
MSDYLGYAYPCSRSVHEFGQYQMIYSPSYIILTASTLTQFTDFRNLMSKRVDATLLKLATKAIILIGVYISFVRNRDLTHLPV